MKTYQNYIKECKVGYRHPSGKMEVDVPERRRTVEITFPVLGILLMVFLLLLGGSACNKIIQVDPISNIGAEDYYKSYKDVETALTGSYNGMQSALENEWMLTDLRSDISMQGFPNSSSTINLDFNQLDMFTPPTTLPEIYDYWFAVYKNIRSVNYVLKSLGVVYEKEAGVDKEVAPVAAVTQEQKEKLAGQALVLRAYHYFNLVRLFGGVFLLSAPTDPQAAATTDRSSVDDIYTFIEADLKKAIELLPKTAYGNIADADLGRATFWAAEGLLAKVYLTLDRKADALPLLNDIIDNSGYGLESSFAQVFSTGNEMNQEILFAVRFKAGGVGLGNYMPNLFAPQGSGSGIVNGDGKSYNYPTDWLDSAFVSQDARSKVTIDKYSDKLYAKKFVVPVTLAGDGENDFPILRYADILLMKAEALGFEGPAGTSVALINQVRARSGATENSAGNSDFSAGFYTYPTVADQPGAILDEAGFVHALLNERKLEFAFENQRLFDLIRMGQAIEVMKAHFALEYDMHYSHYQPQQSLAAYQSNIKSEKLILPIPQREIDANTTIKIQQNAGY